MRRDRPGTAVLLLLCLFVFAPALVAQTTTQTSEGMDYINLILRWLHVLFGILWIGHLYFFNFVQGGFEGKLAADLKKVVVPELRPRALYWFRWGAAWTWVTGIFLLGLVYYVGFKDTWTSDKAMGFAMVGAVLLIFFVYDIVAKKLGPFTPAGLGVNLLLLAGMIVAMGCVGKFDGRALFIHTGGMLGTVM